MQPLEGTHRRHARARDRRAVRHAPARRPRRPRDQDRAPRRRRLRPRLRRPRARPGLALRLDQPLQGKPDARRQAPRRAPRCWSAWCWTRPTSWCRTSRPAPPRAWAWATTRCRATKPRVIVCDISGYGADGPYRDKKAYDLLIQSEAGFVSVTGTPDEPCKAGPSIADIAAGMYAYTNILAALLQRRPDRPRPAHRHLDAGVAGRVDELSAVLRLRRRPAAAAHRRRHATIYPYGPFPTGDGGTVMLGLQNEREWVNFCDKVLQQPELATRPALHRQRQARGRARRAARSSSSRRSRR